MEIEKDTLVVLEDIESLNLKKEDQLNWSDEDNLYRLKEHNEDMSDNKHCVSSRTIELSMNAAKELIDLQFLAPKKISYVSRSNEVSTSAAVSHNDIAIKRLDYLLKAVDDISKEINELKTEINGL